MKKLTTYLLFAMMALFVMASCTATKTAGNDDVNADRKVAESGDKTLGSDENNIPLEQYLRKVPGIQVSGNGSNARVTIAGMGNTSIVSRKEPLYVINNVRVNSLAQASNLVQTSNIKSIRILKSASETSFYGSAGANGVIVIKLKKK